MASQEQHRVALAHLPIDRRGGQGLSPPSCPHSSALASRQMLWLQGKSECEGMLGKEVALQGCCLLIIWSMTLTNAFKGRQNKGEKPESTGRGWWYPAPGCCVCRRIREPFPEGQMLCFYELFKTLSLEAFIFFFSFLNLIK